MCYNTCMKSNDELLKTIASLQNQLKEKEISLKEKDGKIEQLTFRIDCLLRYRYTSRSEKIDSSHPQMRLFNEITSDAAADEDDSITDEEHIEVPAHKRKKRGRKSLPNDLPRIRRDYDLSDEEKICACGSTLNSIGESISEQLEIIPAVMYVVQHVKKKYACKSCEETIKQAKAPAQAIPKSNAGPGLLSHILISKYEDHLPLYRQENILKRIGMEISRPTLCNWVIRCGQLFQPIINLLRKEINQYNVAYSDETTVQVLKEPERAPDKKSYMWVFGGGPPDKFSWVYQYHPSRSGDIPRHFFDDFSGHLHVDGYAGYHSLNNTTLVGCWAHVRRMFFEVAKSAKNKKGLAHHVISELKKLYKIEKDAKKQDLSSDDIKQLRQNKSRPLIEKLFKWLDEKAMTTSSQAPIGKAIAYAQNQRKKLIQYLDDGRLEIDNNRSERAVKPFVIGRKNWMFSDRVRGAEAGANIYSLIETCKANGVEPYSYLRYLLKTLPITHGDDLEALLPYNCAADLLVAEQFEDRKSITRIIAASQAGT